MAEIEGQPQPRRSFTEEFKRETVRLATEPGNVSAVARDLGIHESVLNRWKRQLQQEGSNRVRARVPFPATAMPATRNWQNFKEKMLAGMRKTPS